MKRTILTLALVAATSAMTAFAQDATPAPAASAGPRHHEGWKGGEGPMRGILESLTPAERQQLMAARKKAKDDPAVAEAKKNLETARKAFEEADRAAMLKVDPTIGPVLDKVAEAMKAHRPHMDRPEGAPEVPKD